MHPSPITAHLAHLALHQGGEIAINEQINIEYNVSYIYHAMYAYFARDNVYLPGIAKHFHKESLEERGHVEPDELPDHEGRKG